MERKLRKIITGHKDKGKLIVKYDGSPLIPFGDYFKMLVTDNYPGDYKHQKDAAKRKIRLDPPSKGSMDGAILGRKIKLIKNFR